ncbi:hypothetical protein [Streptomyces rubiginosohelvolus]|uniref:hypothetical protein n=1 Tax=Streptomyces rubiginosohelvolus TaxID=67362 RepID=UPI003F4D716E
MGDRAEVGAVRPARVWRGMIQVRAKGAEPAFARWTEWTAKRNSTYRLGRTLKAVRKTFYDLVAQADRKPIGVAFHPHAAHWRKAMRADSTQELL